MPSVQVMGSGELTADSVAPHELHAGPGTRIRPLTLSSARVVAACSDAAQALLSCQRARHCATVGTCFILQRSLRDVRRRSSLHGDRCDEAKFNDSWRGSSAAFGNSSVQR